MATLTKILGTWIATAIAVLLMAAAVVLGSHPEKITRQAVPRAEVSRLMRYHGVNGIRIEPDGRMAIKRDGKWIAID